MIRLTLLFVCWFGCVALAAPPKGGPQYRTDSATVAFLRRHLVSGAEIQYPREALHAKVQGSGFYRMTLRPDGTVESVERLEGRFGKIAEGHPLLDRQVKQALSTYKFKPKTKGPLIWLVSFALPATIYVQLHR
jgi:TonB family protein